LPRPSQQRLPGEGDIDLIRGLSLAWPLNEDQPIIIIPAVRKDLFM
jgi:hypothetical protein